MTINRQVVSEAECATFRGPEGAIVYEVVMRVLGSGLKEAAAEALDPFFEERPTYVAKGKVAALKEAVKTLRRIQHQVPDDSSEADIMDAADEDYELMLSEVE